MYPSQRATLDWFKKHFSAQCPETLRVYAQDPNLQQDYILEVETLYCYPKIPPAVATNARYRYKTDPANPDDMILLCLQEQEKGVLLDKLLLTLDAMYWLDSKNRQVHTCLYTELTWLAALFSDHEGEDAITGIQFYHTPRPDQQNTLSLGLHPAIVENLISFLNGAGDAARSARVNLHTASFEQLLTIPGVTRRHAQALVSRQGQGKTFDSIAAAQAFLGLKGSEHEGFQYWVSVDLPQSKGLAPEADYAGMIHRGTSHNLPAQQHSAPEAIPQTLNVRETKKRGRVIDY